MRRSSGDTDSPCAPLGVTPSLPWQRRVRWVSSWFVEAAGVVAAAGSAQPCPVSVPDGGDAVRAVLRPPLPGAPRCHHLLCLLLPLLLHGAPGEAGTAGRALPGVQAHVSQQVRAPLPALPAWLCPALWFAVEGESLFLPVSPAGAWCSAPAASVAPTKRALPRGSQRVLCC